MGAGIGALFSCCFKAELHEAQVAHIRAKYLNKRRHTMHAELNERYTQGVDTAYVSSKTGSTSSPGGGGGNTLTIPSPRYERRGSFNDLLTETYGQVMDSAIEYKRRSSLVPPSPKDERRRSFSELLNEKYSQGVDTEYVASVTSNLAPSPRQERRPSFH